jgi:hypothetical protein
MLGQIATLIGLLVAALALFTSGKISGTSLTILASLLIIVVTMFGLTAIFAAVSMPTRNPTLWIVAQYLYPLSWIVFLFGMVMIILLFAYGPSVFTFKLPNTSTTTNSLSLVLSIVSAAVGVLTALFTSRNTTRRVTKDLEKLEQESVEKGPSERQSSEILAEEAVQPTIDSWRIEFLNEAKKTESLLWSIARAKNIDLKAKKTPKQITRELIRVDPKQANVYKLLDDIWDFRSNIVHGIEVPQPLALRGLLLARNLRVILENISHN